MDYSVPKELVAICHNRKIVRHPNPRQWNPVETWFSDYETMVRLGEREGVVRAITKMDIYQNQIFFCLYRTNTEQ